MQTLYFHASYGQMKELRHQFHEETSVFWGGHWFHEGTSMCPREDIISMRELRGVLYALKNTKNPQLNCQPGVSKLRVVELYVPRKKG
jgi:hypothetical protein